MTRRTTVLSSDNIWLPYLYQYGVGGVIFLIGLILILGHGSAVPSRRQDRRWLIILVGGFFWFAGLHLVWYLAAIFASPPVAG